MATDNFGGTYRVAEYLISKGHRDIAFAKGKDTVRNARDRFEGFIHAMKRNNLSLQKNWILDGDFTPESGQDVMRKIISSGKLPSALICANDLMALGALSEAKNANIKVPDNMAIIGFDGIGLTAFTDPPLTTVRQPLYNMGFTASEMLFNRIKDPGRLPEYKIFPVELIERKSA